MIDISKLTEADKGREVQYTEPAMVVVPKELRRARRIQFGVISTWNKKWIFVRYGQDHSAVATYPEDLEFL